MARKQTMKEQIASLAQDARVASQERNLLWNTLNAIVNAPNWEAQIAAMGEAKKALAETVRCSCGRHASMWQGGTGPRMCETCMSS